MKKTYLEVAKELMDDKFKNTKCAFAHVEPTEPEYIHLLIVFDDVLRQNTYKEKTTYNGFKIRMFITNARALENYFNYEKGNKVPYLVKVISEGKVLPEGSAYGSTLNKKAKELLERGVEVVPIDESDHVPESFWASADSPTPDGANSQANVEN